MIPSETPLFIFEIHGETDQLIVNAPDSYLGLWNEEDFSYLFFTSDESEYVRSIADKASLTITSRHEMTYGDWQTGLPSSGLKIGGLEFVSVNHPFPSQDALLLDPSVVFGDGAHPTTLRCLKMTADIIGNNDIKSMLDLGTGTGILALAGAKLGVARIVAIDRNKLAVKTARDNVHVNSFDQIIRIEEGESRLFIDTPYDLVTANLPYQVLRDLITLRSAGLHKFWVISGINSDQSNVLKELICEQGYRIIEQHEDPPWVTFGACLLHIE